MAFSLKNTLFKLFTIFYHTKDINKDGNNKGTVERLNEALGQDYDDNVEPMIVNLVDYNLVPQTAFDKYIPYLEQRLGNTLFMGESFEWRRRVLRYLHRWYSIKGTVRCYILLLRMLGFTGVNIVEDFNKYTFDSPVTFDDDKRTFDLSCNVCGTYCVELTGSIAITPEIVQAIFSIIEFNEPIHAILEKVTYNGGVLVQQIITVQIDGFGNLIYNNDFDPSLILTLVDGDLIVDGPLAFHYSLVDGDLIFTI